MPRLKDCIKAAGADSMEQALKTAAGSGRYPDALGLYERWVEYARMAGAGEIDTLLTNPVDAERFKRTFERFMVDGPQFDQLEAGELAAFLQNQLNKFVEFLTVNIERDAKAEIVWARNISRPLNAIATDDRLKPRQKIDKLLRTAMSTLVPDWSGKATMPINVWTHVHSVRARYQADAAEFFNAFRDGVRGRAAEEQLAREIANRIDGRPVGPIGRAIDNMFHKSLVRLRTKGVLLNEIPGYIPTTADADLLIRMGEQGFIDFAHDLLDWNKIVDKLTGEPFSRAERKAYMSGLWKSLTFSPNVTGSPADPARQAFNLERGPMRRIPLAERIGVERSLVFKDAESRRLFKEKLSTIDDAEEIFSYMPRSAQYEAILDVFGPNPDKLIDRMARRIKEIAVEVGTANQAAFAPPARWSKQWLKETLGPGTSAHAALAKIQQPGMTSEWERVYNELTGLASVPSNVAMADTVYTMKNWAQAAMLGSTIFAQVADLVPFVFAQRLLGMSPYRSMWDHTRNFFIGSAGDREQMVRQAFIADLTIGNSVYQATQFTGEGGSKWSRVASELSFNLQGARRWIETQRYTFGMEMASTLTGLRGMPFEQLPEQWREVFRQHHINASHWNIYRNAPLVDVPGGAQFLLPTSLLQTRHSLAPETWQRFADMFSFWQLLTSPTPDARTRAFLRLGQQPGSVGGSIVQLTTFLKSFPMTMLMQQLNFMFRNPLSQRGGTLPHIARLVEMAGVGTVLGMISMTLFGMSRGMSPPSFDPTTKEGRQSLTQAVLRSGMMAFMGDTIMGANVQGVTGVLSWVAGPILTGGIKVGLAEPVRAATGQTTLDQMMTNQFAALRDFAPGRSFWPTAMLYERLILDQMTSTLGGSKYFENKERNAARTGQEYWWRPGEAVPEFAQ